MSSRCSTLLRATRCRISPVPCNVRSISQKPYYVTTPIFYPNADPHIGHLYSTVLADILVRYHRLKEPEQTALFVTGTDEHGSKIQRAAASKGLEGRELEFCDTISQRFKQLASTANLSHTRFIRTTEPEHAKAVSHLWMELKNRGYIYKGAHRGWYSISDETFYSSTQVEAIIDAISGEEFMVSKETGTKVEWTEEENYKFRLCAFRELLATRYETDKRSIIPEDQYNFVRQTLVDPDRIADISISRPASRLKWGIHVPDDPEHVIYVWVDALTSYLTAVGYPWSGGNQAFAHGWPPNVQIIGKDILRFHAIYLPAFLLALDLPLPITLLSHAHWTIEQKKMSKSIGNVADPFKSMDKYDPDVVRYYLARVGGRFQGDNDWSEAQLFKYYRELFSIVGNQLNRAFSQKVIERLPVEQRNVPISRDVFGDIDGDNSAHKGLENLASNYQIHMDALELGEALEAVVMALRKSDTELAQTAPWSVETPPSTVSRLLSYTRETLRICGILLQPFIPEKSRSLLDSLAVPLDKRVLKYAKLGMGQEGNVIEPVKPVSLFQKIK